MNGIRSDCRHGLRLFARTPGTSLVAVIVLAVGLAFVAAFLSLYVALALKPFPGIEDSGRLVTISELNSSNGYSLQLGFVERLAEEVTSLEAVVGIGSAILPIGREGERANLEYVSRGFFEGIRPRLALGRGIDAAEHELDSEPVVVLSDRFWREQYAGSADVLGETIELIPSRPGEGNAEATELRIIGVMAPDMHGIMSDDIHLWVSLERLLPFLNPGEADQLQLRREQYVRTVGRLRPGVSVEGLVSELEARFQGEAIQGPGTRFDAVNGVARNILVYRDAERQLGFFLAGSVLLALVAAANVSLFLLARAPGRRRELAIRMSVGASLKRLARQLAIESGLLLVVAAMLGLLVSIWVAGFLRATPFLRSADWRDVTLLDWRVLSLVGIVLLVLTLLVSLAPILGLNQLRLAASSRQVAARATLAQWIAGTVQIAVAATFGAAAIAFIWFLGPIVFGNPGYDVEDRHVALLIGAFVFDASLDRPSAGFDADRQRELIEALPGVSAATFTTAVPGQVSGGFLKRPVLDPADPSREVPVGYAQIDSRYVDVLGLRLLHGRPPLATETGVSVVNQALARLLFDRDNVVGESIEIAGDGGFRTEIVGVLEDLSFGHPAAAAEPVLFAKVPVQAFVLNGVIESALPSNALMEQLRDLYDSGVLELQPNFVMQLAEFRNRRVAPDKARGLLTIGAANLVVLLAAFGFYGVQRYLVATGRREYAIRASLGAGPRSLGRLVLGRGLLLSLPGLVIGALLAFIVVAWLRDSYLSREISLGAVTAAVVIALTLLLLGASLGPALQARKTAPAPLLRED